MSILVENGSIKGDCCGRKIRLFGRLFETVYAHVVV
jgi:hypothetical protein